MAHTPLNIGLIGAGRMGQLYARILQEDGRARVVALVGHSPENTAQAATQLGVPGYADGHTERLWAAHDLDAVIVATPEWAHRAPTLDALARGLPVLLEKPIAHSLDDARAIEDAAAGQVVMPCHVCRFDPRFSALRVAAQEGDLGPLRHAYTRRSTPYPVYERLAGRCHPAYWLAPHDVDLLRWITGAEVVSVRAAALEDGTGARDGLFLDLRLSNGLLARVETTWSDAPLNGLWRWDQFDLSGEDGRADCIPSEGGLRVHYAGGRVTAPDMFLAPEINGRVGGAFAAMIGHFLDVITRRVPPLVTLADGLASIRVAAAAERSLHEGRTVRLGEIT